MITAENAHALKNEIGKAFAFPNVQGQTNGNGGYHRLSVNVQKINTKQLLAIAQAATNADAEVELKRSGTGISIHFN